MFNQTVIAISASIAFGGAFAAPVQEASNKSPQYSSPDSTPNGPFFYVETLGVPPSSCNRITSYVARRTSTDVTTVGDFGIKSDFADLLRRQTIQATKQEMPQFSPMRRLCRSSARSRYGSAALAHEWARFWPRSRITRPTAAQASTMSHHRPTRRTSCT
jgi:hypothetical protein